MFTILDCYTDEPAGLGVPPYLGTYPRYIYGYLKQNAGERINYLTIDDLRLLVAYNGIMKKKPKTDITVYNLTRSSEETKQLLDKTIELIIILGVHTPGKYLSAVPGTLNEVIRLLKTFRFRKTLTGPAVYGTSTEGGRFFEKADLSQFNEIKSFDFSYNDIRKYSLAGAEIIRQIPSLRVIELETGRGCSRKKGCSFCLEPIKNQVQFRDKYDIIMEIESLYGLGVRDFRLGKQSCFYSYPDAAALLETIKKQFPGLRTLHIDNANPMKVITEKGKKLTQSIIEHCSPGNVAAFGVESFDSEVIQANNLNSNPEATYEAVKIINEQGKEIGDNGMQKFLPGINLLFGLNKESKRSHEENMKWLKKILDNNLLLRRINIRQVNIFEGTPLYNSVGNKFLKKNRKYYWKWRNDIRQKIDSPMLKNLLPEGRLLKGVRAEVHDGNTTF